MHIINDKITQVRARLHRACHRIHRNSNEVTLLAVSKTKTAADIRAAFAAEQRHFGENYLQEALEKQQQLVGLNIVWHFIGPIQSNKTGALAEHFQWVHSVDRLKIARRLSEQRLKHLPALNICLQVNLDNEASKSGVTLAELPALADAVAKLPHLKLRGLMAIPAPRSDVNEQQQSLERLQQALKQLNQQGYTLDTLSMGMSGDLEAAIAAGSTMVRIGTDIFGARTPRTSNN
jgi:pyridoxal phosphate enzyme (YggS family)